MGLRTSQAWQLAASAVFTAAIFPAASAPLGSAAQDIACGGVGADARQALSQQHAGARATIPEHGAGTIRLALGFPETAVDGDLDTRASPGEKQQEKTP